MLDILFYVFSGVALGGGLMMVLSRNTVTGAMFMIVSLLGVGALFIELEAYLLGVVQVLVYAGAVMVLFLFIIMLLDVKEEERHRIRKWTMVLSLIGVGLLVVGGVKGIDVGLFKDRVLSEGSGVAAIGLEGGMKAFGASLFTKYLLPFEVAGVLLLVGMLGVVGISKKEKEDKKQEVSK